MDDQDTKAVKRALNELKPSTTNSISSEKPLPKTRTYDDVKRVFELYQAEFEEKFKAFKKLDKILKKGDYSGGMEERLYEKRKSLLLQIFNLQVRLQMLAWFMENEEVELPLEGGNLFPESR